MGTKVQKIVLAYSGGLDTLVILGWLREEYDAEVVAYCGSGVSACHDLIAMEHAGLGRGRLYVGSWSQWSATDRPASTGP